MFAIWAFRLNKIRHLDETAIKNAQIRINILNAEFGPVDIWFGLAVDWALQGTSVKAIDNF